MFSKTRSRRKRRGWTALAFWSQNILSSTYAASGWMWATWLKTVSSSLLYCFSSSMLQTKSTTECSIRIQTDTLIAQTRNAAEEMRPVGSWGQTSVQSKRDCYFKVLDILVNEGNATTTTTLYTWWFKAYILRAIMLCQFGLWQQSQVANMAAHYDYGPKSEAD